MKRTLLVALGLGLLTFGCGQPPTDASPTATPTATMSDSSPTAPSPDTSASGSPSAMDPGKPMPPEKGETGKEKSTGGMTYTVVKPGDGKVVEKGDKIKAHYTGWLTDGTKFDSSLDRGEPLDLQIGQGMVIKGWDEGIPGMKVGETRRLYIPADMAYGASGTPGGPIPPNAPLVFEVTVVEDAGK